MTKHANATWMPIGRLYFLSCILAIPTLFICWWIA